MRTVAATGEPENMTIPLSASARDAPAHALGRLASFVLRRVLRRGGSAGPGLLADRLSPGLLARSLGALPDGLVVVSGSSGKSTTTRMLTALLEAHGLRVFTNASTANLRQGVVTAIVDAGRVGGGIPADIGVVELDEGAAASLAGELRPRLLVLTNVSAEQLDRFHSADRVVGMLARLADRSAAVVLGRDDDRLRELASRLAVPVRWFGTSDDVRGVRVDRVDGRDATLALGGRSVRVRLPARGEHYALDAAAALEAAHAILGPALDHDTVVQAFAALTPVFGRGELVDVGGAVVELVLVQNPDSLRRNLALLSPAPEQLMIAIGSDVRDASWLWNVDTSCLGHVDVVTGCRAYEIGARLAYDGVRLGTLTPDLNAGLDEFMALPAPDAGVKTILFSADAMRRVRRRLRLDRGVRAG